MYFCTYWPSSFVNCQGVYDLKFNNLRPKFGPHPPPQIARDRTKSIRVHTTDKFSTRNEEGHSISYGFWKILLDGKSIIFHVNYGEEKKFPLRVRKNCSDRISVPKFASLFGLTYLIRTVRRGGGLSGEN